MTALATSNSGAMVTADQAAAMRTALKSSLYPGASDPSIDLVLAYCQAAQLDPMVKPVHIVPMKVKTGQLDQYGNDVKETRDVIMPGIGLYRIKAARTNGYVGCSAPQFGPMKVLKYLRDEWRDKVGGRGRECVQVEDTLEYPEWCQITVLRRVDGVLGEFTALEYWLENYAAKGNGSPNEMWTKRARGQLAKCTEAQALRKAFPEAVGSQPTAEEMEGKTLDVAHVEPPPRPAITFYSEDAFAENLPKWRGVIESGRKSAADIIAMVESKAPMTEVQKAAVLAIKNQTPEPEGEEPVIDGEFTEGEQA
jgi:phage recombination protein Bet